MTTAKDLLSLPSLSHMKLIGGAAGLSRTVTWPYVILSSSPQKTSSDIVGRG